MQYTEKELETLVKSLEKEFAVELEQAFQSAGAAQPSLTKAEDEKPKEDKPSEDKPSEDKPKDSEEKPKEDAAPKADGKEQVAKPEGEAAPNAEQPTGEAPVAPSADEGASGYDAEDIAHMDAMYMSMSKAELLAHHDSCVRALDAIGAEHVHQAPAAQAAAPAPAEQAAPAPAAAPAEMDKCGQMQMQKSEMNPELELAKSEAAVSKAKADELQKSLDTVSEFLTKLVKTVPQGKAITQYEQVTKSESAGAEQENTLSKGEIASKLSAKAADPTLTKSDRDAINAYYLNNANVNTISHLLK